MKRILVAASALLLVIGLIGAGTFAYFFDTETQVGNSFTTGTIDIDLAQSGTVALPMNIVGMTPGDVETYKIQINNIGTIPVGAIFQDFQATGNVDLLKAIMVTGIKDLAYPSDQTALFVAVFDANSDGELSLFELCNNTHSWAYEGVLTNTLGSSAVLNNGENMWFEMTLTLPETHLDQNALMGQTAGFNLKFMATTEVWAGAVPGYGVMAYHE